jgi:hypothetical protein
MVSNNHRTVDDTSSTSSCQELRKQDGEFEARQPQKMKLADCQADEVVYNTNNMTGIFLSAEMANPFHF